MHCTYKRDTEARSRTHFCRGKAISITYSECVSIALVIHFAKAHAPYHTVQLWPVLLYHIFVHYLINGTIFGGKKIIKHKMCVFFSTTFL